MVIDPGNVDGPGVFPMNSRRWALFGRILDLLGEDVRSFEGPADRGYVKRSICRSWAAALRGAIDGGQIRLTEGTTRTGRRLPMVVGRTTRPGSLAEFSDWMHVHFGGEPVNESTPTVALDPELTALILDFASFLETSRGLHWHA